MRYSPEEEDSGSDEHQQLRPHRSGPGRSGSGREKSSRSRRAPSSLSSSRSVDSGGGGGEGRSSRSSRSHGGDSHPSSSRSSSRDVGGEGRSGASSRRSSRRAPNGGPGGAPRRSKSEDFDDYNTGGGESSALHASYAGDMGYGDGTPDLGYGDATPDMGYGDASPDSEAPKPARARRQRRCSIAEVTSSAPAASPEDTESAERPRLQRQGTNDFAAVGTSSNTISNIAIPMAAQEEAPKRKGRRGSMFGAISRNVSSTKEPEPEKTKKPGADRDRRRQGTLLDRVGSRESTRSRSGPASSYSDRIVSK